MPKHRLGFLPGTDEISLSPQPRLQYTTLDAGRARVGKEPAPSSDYEMNASAVE